MSRKPLDTDELHAVFLEELLFDFDFLQHEAAALPVAARVLVLNVFANLELRRALREVEAIRTFEEDFERSGQYLNEFHGLTYQWCN